MAELVNKTNDNNANPIEWLNNTHPTLHVFAMDVVIKRKFPDYVQKHIQDYWIKISAVLRLVIQVGKITVAVDAPTQYNVFAAI